MLTLTGVSTSILHLFNLVFATKHRYTEGESMFTTLSDIQLLSSKRRNPAMVKLVQDKTIVKTLFYWYF